MPDLWMLFPNGKPKALTLSYDDGVEQDIRLMGILNRHGLKATFNINSGLYAPEGHVWPERQIHRRMSRSAVLDLYKNSGHEIAIHACHHGDLPSLPPAYAIWQVMHDKNVLENEFGRIIRGMAYPFGTVTPELAQTLKSCGVAYSRTVESTHRFAITHDWLRLPATCHHDDPMLMELAEKFVKPHPFGPQLFYLWGHSYEFEANNNWHVIENFAQFMSGRDNVWYATNIEIYDYVTAWRGMHISADGRRFHNPSAQPLWLLADGKTYCVEAGGDLVL